MFCEITPPQNFYTLVSSSAWLGGQEETDMLERIPGYSGTHVGGGSRTGEPRPPAIQAVRVRTREILESDIDAVSSLLASGFTRSTKHNWLEIFSMLAAHRTPASLPKYGYLMESDGAPVGAILLISSTIRVGGVSTIRCNLSSWYVSPAFRGFAHLFISRILKNKDFTYINVSPAPNTWSIIKVQGFSRYCDGQFIAAAMSFARSRDQGVKVISAGALSDPRADTFERDLLQAHEKFGCMSVWCVASDGAHPFVFRSRIIRGLVLVAQLIYCRDLVDLVRFARPIGRFLARRGIFFVTIDANGPIPGLVGIYRDGSLPKYYKGPVPPRLGDIAYTESALFGI
jgi:hypothetical protein